MSRKKSPNKYNYNRPNFWGMLQNVLIASLNKGQFFVGVFGLIMIIIILKLSPSDSKELIYDIFRKFGDYHYIGWILGVFSTFGWFLGTKRLRRLNSNEINRISKEKKSLQEVISKKKQRSSK